MSISWVSTLNPSGPNHFGKCCGSVQTLNIRSRGAATTRDRTISRSSAHEPRELLFPSPTFAMLFLLCLQFESVDFHPVKPRRPDRALFGEPSVGVAHCRGSQFTDPLAPDLSGEHEAALFEHADVLEQGRQCHGPRV